jgi:hypothetical protein
LNNIEIAIDKTSEIWIVVFFKYILFLRTTPRPKKWRRKKERKIKGLGEATIK